MNLRSWHGIYMKTLALWKEMSKLSMIRISFTKLLNLIRKFLYKSRLHLFPGKLRFRLTRPYIVKMVFSHWAIEIVNPSSRNVFKVNGQRLKPFLKILRKKKWSRNLKILSTRIQSIHKRSCTSHNVYIYIERERI